MTTRRLPSSVPPMRLTPVHWREAVEAAASEIARHALSLSGATVRDPVGVECTALMVGAHVPLIGSGTAFDLALVSTPEACAALARAMLYLPSTAPLTAPEIADALGELANMLGGLVKRRMQGLGSDFELGLPIFIHGHVQPTDRMSVIALPTTFGSIETIVSIIGHR